MNLKNYNIKKNITFRNQSKHLTIEDVLENMLSKIIDEVREEVMSETSNEMFDLMKLKGIENIDEYVLHLINERVLVQELSVSVKSRFSNEQANEINRGSETLTDDELMLIKDSRIDHKNMKIIRESLEEGLPLDKIKLIDPKMFSSDSLLELKNSVAEGATEKELQVLTSVFGSLGSHDIIAVKEVLNKHGIDAAEFSSNNRFRSGEIYKIILALDNGVKLNTIKRMFTKGVDEFLMDLIIKALSEYKLSVQEVYEYKEECLSADLSYSESHDLLRLISNGGLEDIYA